MRCRRIQPLLAGKLAQLRALGLPMAVGSDAGSPLHFQAGAIWWELEAWRAAGIPAREALIAATEGGARVYAICVRCEKRAGNSLRPAWLTVLGWVLGPLAILAAAVLLLAWITSGSSR